MPLSPCWDKYGAPQPMQEIVLSKKAMFIKEGLSERAAEKKAIQELKNETVESLVKLHGDIKNPIFKEDEEPEKKSSITVIQPEENKPPNIVEPVKSEPPVEPLKESSPNGIYVEQPPTSLSYSGTGKLETEFGVNERTPTETKHDIETIKEADNLIEKGWNVKDALNKIENEGHTPSDAEYINLTRYAAELSERLRKTDIHSPEYDKILNQLNRVANASNLAGREQGRALGIRGRFKTVQEGSYADFMLDEMVVNNDAPLTKNQKETATKEFNNLEEKTKDFQGKAEELATKASEKAAGLEIKKTSKATPKNTKKTHDDFVKDRNAIIEAAKEKIKKAREKANDSDIQKMGIGGRTKADDLITIAPDVLKLAKSFIEEGVQKLEEVVRNIHAQLKGDISDLKDKDIHDIIAGEYTKKRPTKTELAIAAENLRIEAKLVNRLDALQKQGEPKSEKVKIKRNQEIGSLRNKIKDYRKEEAEANKFFGESDSSNRAAEKKQDAAQEKEANKFYGEEKNPQRAALENIKKKNEKATAEIKEKIAKGDFEPDAKKTPILQDKELQKNFPSLYMDVLKSKDEYIKAKHEIALRRAKQMYENKTPEEKAIEVFSKTLNVPRTLMASMDFSAPLRQGIVASAAHPILASKALRFMFEAAKDEKVYNRWLDDVHSSPRWEVAEKTGLGITDPESLHVKAAEEAFQGAPYAEKIPIAGALVKGSERAYIGYLNKLRWDIFNMYADRFEAQGKTYENNPKLYEGISSLVNSETGRGGMKGLEGAAPIFNWFLFASKLIASRLNMLGLTDLPNLAVRGATLGKYGLDYGFYTRLPKELRIEAAKDMAKFVATGMATLMIAKGIAKATGNDDLEVELDPRSSDFGKIRVGNTRWDIWGGFQPYARVLTQSLMGERKATTTGKIYQLNGEGFMKENRLSPLLTFARGKLAPIPSSVWNLASGYDLGGNKVSWENQLLQNVTPLVISDVMKAMQDNGVKALFTVGIPAAFGVGVQTFQPRISSSKSDKPETYKSDHKREAPEKYGQ